MPTDNIAMTLKILADDYAPSGHLNGTPQAMRLDPSVSPLVLCDRLLTLAKDVDRAGLRDVAERLIELAGEVLQRPRQPSSRTQSSPTIGGPKSLCGLLATRRKPAC
jgi:hypothetical protein